MGERLIGFLGVLGVLLYSGGIYPVLISFAAYFILIQFYRTFINFRMKPPKQCAILITGCSSGAGLACAQHFASLGLTVLATSRNPLDERPVHPNLIWINLDLAQSDHVINACLEIKEILVRKNLRLAALINNAGYGEIGPLETLDLDKIRKLFEGNVFGHLSLTQKMLPLLRVTNNAANPIGGTYHPSQNRNSTGFSFFSLGEKYPPKIIFLGSGASHLPMPFLGAFAASKQALIAMADTLRLELKPWNVRVITILPGAMETKFFQKALQNNRQNLMALGKALRENFFLEPPNPLMLHPPLIPEIQGHIPLEEHPFWELFQENLGKGLREAGEKYSKMAVELDSQAKKNAKHMAHVDECVEVVEAALLDYWPEDHYYVGIDVKWNLPLFWLLPSEITDMFFQPK